MDASCLASELFARKTAVQVPASHSSKQRFKYHILLVIYIHRQPSAHMNAVAAYLQFLDIPPLQTAREREIASACLSLLSLSAGKNLLKALRQQSRFFYIVYICMQDSTRSAPRLRKARDRPHSCKRKRRAGSEGSLLLVLHCYESLDFAD